MVGSRIVGIASIAAIAMGLIAFIFEREDAAWSQAVEGCKAISLQCPVAGGCTVTSPFNLTRIDPVAGSGVRPHRGVDLRAKDGTEIRAAADGRVTFAGDAKDAGIAVEIDHAGTRFTRYFHLQTGSLRVKANDPVVKGAVIALSDTTGRTKEPHLHFEYATSGATFNTRGRINPGPCIGEGVNGSIRIRDNGNLADDAFRVAVDGLVLGETSIGQPNSFAINGLRPGQHSLVVTAIVAPDNVGTLQIDLNNGWLFTDGTATKSDTLTQGQAKTYTFNVPNT